MQSSKELAIQFKYENEILELIENQMRNDENSLTQSDVQGRVSAIVMSIISEIKLPVHPIHEGETKEE